MDIIIPSIKLIITYSIKKEILLIYFTSLFWRNILMHYNKANDYCIKICFRLRETFIRYNYLINILFNNKNDEKRNKKEKEIKNEINKFFERMNSHLY